ncbi:MAG: hypothetical protein ACD_24C00180G0001 [uncultured bacterium]|nr:MAG: hypothetical protein ACD_24C00180G0001 [uncultured bacterium]
MYKKHGSDLHKPSVYCIYTDINRTPCTYQSTRALKVGGKIYCYCELHFNLVLLQMAVSKLNYMPVLNSAGK